MSKLLTGLKKAGLIAAGGTALAGSGYGGYKTGKYIGSKQTSKQLTKNFNDQQIANEYYVRGLQEGNVEKTAQEVAQDLLEKLAWNPLPGIGRFISSEGSNLGASAKNIVRSGATKAERGQAALSALKNPLTVGGLGLGAGMAAGGLMTKKSSDESRVAYDLLEKIAKKHNKMDKKEKEESAEKEMNETEAEEKMEKESSDFLGQIRKEAYINELDKIGSLKDLPKAVKEMAGKLYNRVKGKAGKVYQSTKTEMGKKYQVAKGGAVTGAKAISDIAKKPAVMAGAGGLAVGAGTAMALNAGKKKE